MFKEIRNKPQALFWAIALHILIVLVFLLSFKWTDRPDVPAENVAVEVIEPDGAAQPKEPAQAEPARHGPERQAGRRLPAQTQRSRASQPKQKAAASRLPNKPQPKH